MAKFEQQRGVTLNLIQKNHTDRYQFAKDFLKEQHLKEYILDAGCGIGYGSYIMSDYVTKIHSIDREIDAYKVYQEHYKKDNIDFQCSSIQEAKFYEKYDAIISFEFIEHISFTDAQVLVEKFSKLTKWLIISSPNEDVTPYNGYRFHHRHYTETQFKELLTENGFSIHKSYQQLSVKQDDKIIENQTGGKYLIMIAKSNFIE